MGTASTVKSGGGSRGLHDVTRFAHNAGGRSFGAGADTEGASGSLHVHDS